MERSIKQGIPLAAGEGWYLVSTIRRSPRSLMPPSSLLLLGRAGGGAGGRVRGRGREGEIGDLPFTLQCADARLLGK